MMKKKYVLIFLTAFVILFVTGITVSAVIKNELSKQEIESHIESAYQEYEKNKQQSLENLNPDEVLVQGKDFKITLGEFVEHKNLLLYLEQVSTIINDDTNNTIEKSSNLSNKELLLGLLNGYVLSNYAKNLGIEVSKQEVDDYIALNKKMVSALDAISENESDVITKALFENQLKKHGWSEDEFWKLPKVREAYERALLKSKLVDKLIELRKVNDYNDYLEYEAELMAKEIENLEIRWDLLEKVK